MIKKKIFCIMFMLLMLFNCVPTFAMVTDSQPSISYNGIMPDGTCIYDFEYTPLEEDIEPYVSVIYEYLPGYERLINYQEDLTYAHIWNTSVRFNSGSLTKYTLDVSRSISKSTKWGVNANFSGGYDMEVIKSELAISGDYSTTNTAEIKAGQSWEVEVDEPGLYQLDWYMKGHCYTAQCGSYKRTTGSNDGTFAYYTLGTVEFPTPFHHLDVIKQ